jgi:alpha-amylase/alpha-mannosidase (GH57 family)
MTERYICIHGHFYQPPRENAWLEAIEVQDSAYPYHDWNERITAECYATNAASLILNEHGKIVQIVNNYANISFNFGPTLLAWLEANARDVYRTVIQADVKSRERFSGHGSALAQPYHHMILPLAHHRDKYTQIFWAACDFEHRYGRLPEGMWLPETAVDLESLDVMAQLGIKFSILSPHQAAKIRPFGKDRWSEVPSGAIDTTIAYRLQLPSGRNMALFFYNAPISRAVGFENILKSGKIFAKKLTEGFHSARQGPQMVHIAVDGETYGHHQRLGDIALAYAVHTIEANGWARVTNYGEFLERHPPACDVGIYENTSWSCPHGIERWRSDCGCQSGKHLHWNQAWRGPLRTALDWLRDALAPAYETKIQQYLKDPWPARNDYIHILLDRSPKSIEAFFHRHAKHPLSKTDKSRVLKLLEIQHQTMLMYTSCGWFFDDISGIETLQIIQYAGRALQLTSDIFGQDLEPRFLEQLARAKSNIRTHGDGRRIYQKFVKPAVVDLKKVAAHYAISSLFEDYPEQTSIFCFSARQHDYHCVEADKAKLVVGHTAVTSHVTGESEQFYFGVLHLGDHNTTCGVEEYFNEKRYQSLCSSIVDLFNAADFPRILKLLDQHFKGSLFSLKSLFRDQQRKILDLLIEPAIPAIISAYRHLYEPHMPLLRFLKDSGSHPPKVLSTAAELVLNHDLWREFDRELLDYEAVHRLLEEVHLAGIILETDTLEYTLRKNLERVAVRFQNRPEEFELLDSLATGVKLVNSLPFDVNLRKVQNVYYELLHRVYPDCRRQVQNGDQSAGKWVERFIQLGEKLLIHMEEKSLPG